MRGGLVSFDTISALPSNENDSRTREREAPPASDRVDEQEEGGKESVLVYGVSLTLQSDRADVGLL